MNHINNLPVEDQLKELSELKGSLALTSRSEWFKTALATDSKIQKQKTDIERKLLKNSLLTQGVTLTDALKICDGLATNWKGFVFERPEKPNQLNQKHGIPGLKISFAAGKLVADIEVVKNGEKTSFRIADNGTLKPNYIKEDAKKAFSSDMKNEKQLREKLDVRSNQTQKATIEKNTILKYDNMRAELTKHGVSSENVENIISGLAANWKGFVAEDPYRSGHLLQKHKIPGLVIYKEARAGKVKADIKEFSADELVADIVIEENRVKSRFRIKSDGTIEKVLHRGWVESLDIENS
jgi:hypothetical protein